ncbi:phosphoenolpyruvate carboxykinase [Candidatus Micrarchaeota archaeon]|nr:phosphoenolpyruvate carboxykinase [Candidatus Micrarchaeota archaeon]
MDFPFLAPLMALRDATKQATVDQLLEYSADRLDQTASGGITVQSKVTHRLAAQTQIVFEPEIEHHQLVQQATQAALLEDLVRIDRNLGKNAFSTSLLLPKKYGWIGAYSAATLFEPKKKELDFLTLCLPEWPEPKVLVLADAGVTLILGSDYVGEAKMSFLRLAMYHAKKLGGLGLHAGSKHVTLKNGEKGVLFFGLSGTGKTTLSTHELFLREPEQSVVRQDDIVLWQQDGAALGTEQNFYVKTEGLGPQTHPGLFKACTSDKALLENVAINSGQPDFSDTARTSNGRAIVFRRELPHTDDQVDLRKVDVIFFITRRRDIVPAVAKLSSEQAAAFFMLGESVETSAGDPTRAGQTKRVVGFNPFVVGNPAEEGNRFLELLKKTGAQTFLLNTGRVGEKVNITADISAKLVEQIIRGNVKWKADEDWAYEVPDKVGSLDMSALDPRQYYSESAYKEKVNALKAERKAWLEKFNGLKSEIVNAIDLKTA